MTKPVITRFAPSPTGYLHIGGARTALFNWLYAKANGGQMLLRIEDTDRARSSDEAIDAIKDGLTWLGLDWDGEAVSQHARADRHREVAEQMVTEGKAYKCFCSPEKLTAMREDAKAKGLPMIYDGTCRKGDTSHYSDDTPYVIRLMTPNEGTTDFTDEVQGEMKYPNEQLDDLVLVRADGNPTYMLAVVVDDHDMGVTHIIRGDDHLTNAARQIQIYNALGWDVPDMAHIPLIHGEDGAKLSKRHGAIGAEKYRDMGYLPQALRNYLVKLGWSHGDDEIISLEQMIEWFGFAGMNKAAARFGTAKLDALNAHYMRESDDVALLEYLEPLLDEIEYGSHIKDNLNERTRPMLLRAMPSLKDRAKTLVDLVQGAGFIFDKCPLQMEDKAQKHLDEDGLAVIANVLPELENITDWSEENIDKVLRDFTQEKDLKLGKVAQPIRAALTGKATSPGAFDVLYILGKNEALLRLKDQVK